MPNICIFKVSDVLFQGFEILLDLDYYDSNEEICNQMKQSLIGFLENHNFEVLVLKAQDLNLHIHDVEFGTILLADEDDEVWVCGGCMENQIPCIQLDENPSNDEIIEKLKKFEILP